MNLATAIGYVKKSKGRFLSLEFVKRTDGTVRRMLCRTGVKCFLKGGVPAYDFESKGLLPVYDMVKHEYRSVPLDGLTQIKVDGNWLPVTKE